MSRRKSDVSLKFNTEKYSFEEQVAIYNILQKNFTKVPCKIFSFVGEDFENSDHVKLNNIFKDYFSKKLERINSTYSIVHECSGRIYFKEEVSLRYINDLWSYNQFTDLFKLGEISYDEEIKTVYITIRKL